jgi:hypothetical protein|tara:strand:+ start:14019 stop:14312 length:294 start_codon:yes stop_codon:yes gene_type:complete
MRITTKVRKDATEAVTFQHGRIYVEKELDKNFIGIEGLDISNPYLCVLGTFATSVYLVEMVTGKLKYSANSNDGIRLTHRSDWVDATDSFVLQEVSS